MNNMELETDIEALDMEMGDVTIHYCPVIPNPEGEPTAELKTAEIEGEIYEIVDEEARTSLENKVDKEEGKGLSENDYTDEDKAIVDGVTTALNGKVDKVQGKGLSTNDYDDTAKGIVDGVTSALDGKADKSNTYTKTETDNLLSAKANTSDLSTVATSGSYNDLSNTPNLSTVATSGDYDDLLNKPNLSTVATSGSYDDLTDKPTIDTAISPTSTNAVQNKVIYDLLNDLLPEATETGNPISITNASGLNAKSLKVELEPIQDTSGGEPSPTNICPISGRTQTVVSVNSEDTTIPFNQTVYGGEVDVTSGGTKPKYYIEYDGSNDEYWEMYNVAQGKLFRTSSSHRKTSVELVTLGVFCNAYKVVSQQNRTDGTLSGGTGSGQYGTIDFIDNRFSSLDQWRANLSSNPIQLCFDDSNPTEINTPAFDIPLNKGNNTLTADGDMELVYSKTPQ